MKSANHTIITLILKTLITTNMWDFRPISSINYMYKLMTKILMDRMVRVLCELISSNQTTLKDGIWRGEATDNTLLVEEMVYGFCGKRIPKRCCCLSIDLRKAFDIVRWGGEAITSTLEAYGFSLL